MFYPHFTHLRWFRGWVFLVWVLGRVVRSMFLIYLFGFEACGDGLSGFFGDGAFHINIEATTL